MFQSPTSVDSGTLARLERVVEQLESKNALQGASTADPAAFSSVDSSQRSQRLAPASASLQQPPPPSSSTSPSPSPSIESLPQSLTEIYDISNRNRWRNKDKKRNRDPSLDAADSAAEEDGKEEVGGAVSGGAGDDDWYSTGQDAFADKGLEGTVSELCQCILASTINAVILCAQLDLATGIGWVQQASREEVKAKHLADEHINATAQLQTPSGDDMMHDRSHADSSSVTSRNRTCWKSFQLSHSGVDGMACSFVLISCGVVGIVCRTSGLAARAAAAVGAPRPPPA